MDAVLYARVSSDKQEREGFSIPAQLDLLRSFAQSNGLIVVREFVEAESAKASGREAFGDMLEFLLRPGSPKLILVEKTDRLYRNFKDYVLVNDLIDQLGLEVRFVKEGEVMGPNASSHSKFIHSIKVVLAKNYIDNLREETAKGRRQKAIGGGWACRAPFGYKMNLRKELEVHPENAKIIKQAFALYATGDYSLKSVCDLLYAAGHLYQTSMPRMPINRLEYFLKNPVYIGKVNHKGEWFEGNHEPLVDLDTFERAQESFQRKARPCVHGSVDLVYRGQVKCGECGRYLVGEVKKGKYVYYRCSSFKNQCSQGYIKEEVLNQAVEEVFLKTQLSASVKELVLTAARESHDLLIASVDTHRASLQQKIAAARTRLRQAYTDRLDGLIDASLYSDTQKTLQEALLALETALSRITTAEVNYYQLASKVVELPKKAAALWSLANTPEKSKLLSIFISNFTVMDGKVSLELLEGFEELAFTVENKEYSPNERASELSRILLKFKPIVERLVA